MNTRKLLSVLAIAVAASTLAIGDAHAQSADGSWLVRLRAVNLTSANADSTGLNLAINSKVLPEVDVSYFWTPNWATELVLTDPQEQTLTANGTRIGSLRHLPPVLGMQYHVTTLGAFKPYAGIGVNFTRFSNVSFDPAVDAALHPSIGKTSVGPSFQLGFDQQWGRNLVFNVDVKKVLMKTDVKSNGQRIGELRIDPWLVGVGVGWRF